MNDCYMYLGKLMLSQDNENNSEQNLKVNIKTVQDYHIMYLYGNIQCQSYYHCWCNSILSTIKINIHCMIIMLMFKLFSNIIKVIMLCYHLVTLYAFIFPLH